jgi:membrane fusion protein, macrolide-specific efflux system
MQEKLFKSPGARYWIGGLLLAVVLVGMGLWLLFTKPTESEKATLADMSATIEYGDIEENVTAQGKLEPKEYVDVGAQVTGQLQKLHVEIGDVVKAGDLLAEIDPRIYASRVKADEAKINTLKAQLVEQEAQILFADRKYARNQLMFKTNP